MVYRLKTGSKILPLPIAIGIQGGELDVGEGGGFLISICAITKVKQFIIYHDPTLPYPHNKNSYSLILVLADPPSLN